MFPVVQRGKDNRQNILLYCNDCVKLPDESYYTRMTEAIHITRPQKWRERVMERLLEGAAYFKLWLIRGTLFRRGHLFECVCVRVCVCVWGGGGR